jgi:hypothetical protein
MRVACRENFVDQCLVRICERFEEISDFLAHRSQEDDEIVAKLFFDFVDCFSSLSSEKLEYPKEFQKDVKYFLQGEPVMMKQFEDVEFRYLMLSDFYDFCRLTKRYTKHDLTDR